MKLLVWIAALALAALSGAHALSGVTASRAPNVSAMSIPANGEGIANLADLAIKLAVAENEGALPSKLPEGSAELALEAFRLEPLNVAAIRTLALSKSGEETSEQTRTIMRLVSTVSKRERLTNLWLAEDYGRADDLPKALLHYDHLLRTSRSASQALIPVMAQLASRDEAIEPFAELLSADPNWGPQFWQRLVRTRESLGNAAKLRMILAKRGIATEKADDAFMIDLLVKDGDLATARKLRAALVEEASAETGLTNGDFARQPEFAPLDWELVNEGEYGAMIVPERKELLVSAIPSSFGTAARQVFALKPGNYELVVEGAGLEQSPGALKALLRCEGQSRRKALTLLTLENNPQRTPFQVPSGCADIWIELSVDNQEEFPVDITLSSITIEPQG